MQKPLLAVYGAHCNHLLGSHKFKVRIFNLGTFGSSIVRPGVFFQMMDYTESKARGVTSMEHLSGFWKFTTNVSEKN